MPDPRKPTAEPRTTHPFHMYDAILAQPDRIARVLSTQRDAILRAADVAAAKKRILFAGIGTSGHAATLGEFFLRHLTAGRSLARPLQSFEQVHYPLALNPDDAFVVCSHRGWKNFSVQALAAAKKSGALTIAITGEDGGDGIRQADHVIITCEQEISFAHTKSYTAALSALALFALRVAEKYGHAADSVASLAAVDGLPALVRSALTCEPAVRAAAAAIAVRPRLNFVGAGPNWTTAREAALKVKEAAYVHAEGVETEEFLHGPTAELDARASVVGHFTGGPADARLAELFAAAGEVAALRIAVVSQGAAPSVAAEHRIEVPATPEWISAFPHAVAVQLLTYFLALALGKNPDPGREHEPAHARAKTHFQL